MTFTLCYNLVFMSIGLFMSSDFCFIEFYLEIFGQKTRNAILYNLFIYQPCFEGTFVCSPDIIWHFTVSCHEYFLWLFLLLQLGYYTSLIYVFTLVEHHQLSSTVLPYIMQYQVGFVLIVYCTTSTSHNINHTANSRITLTSL